MKLSNVFAAKETITRLAQLKMAPKVAYRVLKFARKFDAEYAIVEKQRSALIAEISGTKEGEEAKIERGTPEFAEFVKQFGAILDVESDLAVCPLTLDALLDALEEADGNTMSVQDIAMLESFFDTEDE